MEEGDTWIEIGLPAAISDSKGYPKTLMLENKQANIPSTARYHKVASKEPEPSAEFIPSPIHCAAGCLTVPDVATQDAPAIDYSKWSVFRMLIPMDGCNNVSYNQNEIEEIQENTKACISIGRPGSEIAVVTIYAKGDNNAMNALLRVHLYFTHNVPSDSPWCSLSLLVPIAIARSFILENKISPSKKYGCTAEVYLTESPSMLPFGYVILSLKGLQEKVHETIQSIASHLRTDESMDSVLEEVDTMVAPPDRTFKLSHYKSIPLSYVAAIIDEQGENIRRIREASSAVVMISSSFNSDLLRIKISSGCPTQINEAKKVIHEAKKMLQDYINARLGSQPAFFENWQRSTVVNCD